MHELSIALSIVEVAVEEAARRGSVRVQAVHLRLGLLAGVVKPALLTAFAIARQDSPLAQADLIVEDVPVQAYCSQCRGPRGVVSVQELRCDHCGALTSEVLGGRELEVVALEIE